MTRTEALRRLHGTWNHELRDGRVHLRDVALVRAVEAIRREEGETRAHGRESARERVLRS